MWDPGEQAGELSSCGMGLEERRGILGLEPVATVLFEPNVRLVLQLLNLGTRGGHVSSIRPFLSHLYRSGRSQRSSSASSALTTRLFSPALTARFLDKLVFLACACWQGEAGKTREQALDDRAEAQVEGFGVQGFRVEGFRVLGLRDEGLWFRLRVKDLHPSTRTLLVPSPQQLNSTP